MLSVDDNSLSTRLMPEQEFEIARDETIDQQAAFGDDPERAPFEGQDQRPSHLVF